MGEKKGEEDDGVWYDAGEQTWKQNWETPPKTNFQENTIERCSVHFDVVGQVRSRNRNLESSAVYVFINVNNQRVRMSVDSGTKETLMPISVFKDLFPKARLRPCQVVLASVEGEHIKVIGEYDVEVMDTNGKLHDLKLVIIDSRKLRVPLVGRRWLDRICPGWRHTLFSMLGEIEKK